ncbi:uncharacterized protein LOC112568949 [Pomacea canaliculata]|uniref:uncharacterized protein LOC112568949 n=1 Tax=Pomacea canaliculata TaxID=400727 RepID=UPI000D735446|nr:uncharacterized protein LOC112568949 [Pomacea canaliculata]
MPRRKKWKPAGMVIVTNEKGRRVRRRVRYTGQQIMDFMNNQNGRLNQPQEQPANNQIPQTESMLVDIPDVIEESSHKKRKICEAEVWQGIRDEMVEVRIESFSPAGNECSFCSREIEDIIWCPDCGPNSVSCNNYNENIHKKSFRLGSGKSLKSSILLILGNKRNDGEVA